jgi:hypothetical protein
VGENFDSDVLDAIFGQGFSDLVGFEWGLEGFA